MTYGDLQYLIMFRDTFHAKEFNSLASTMYKIYSDGLKTHKHPSKLDHISLTDLHILKLKWFNIDELIQLHKRNTNLNKLMQ